MIFNKFILKRVMAFVSAMALTAALFQTDGNVSATFSSSYIDTGDISVTINTSKGHKAISPYIYGINAESSLSGLSVNAVKQSDPRLSSYNWETNYSNNANPNNSENNIAFINTYPQNKWKNPALHTENLVTKAKRYGIASRYVTLQMMGFVAADSLGAVDSSDAESRWNKVVFNKNDSLLSEPDLNDNTVYMDEYVGFLANKYGYAVDGGINGYFLDYEPENWAEIYPTAVKEKVTAEELVSRSAELAAVVKRIDPTALVYGPSIDGIEAFTNLKNPTDWEQYSNEYSWFIDYYLMNMKNASDASGTRLLDVLDIHYHTEATNGILQPIINSTDNFSNNTRLQAPRILWDSTYTENSEIAYKQTQHIPLLPTLEASINMYYPGTKISFSEYNFGGGDNISGGIATADALGIFASYGVHMACLKPNSENIDYMKSAINIYTNYDGIGSTFGNKIVSSDNGGDIMSSVYSAVEGDNDASLKTVIINKNQFRTKNADIEINSNTVFESAEVYSFSKDNPEIVLSEEQLSVENNRITFEMEPLTVYMLVFSGKVEEVIDDSPITETGTSVSESESAATVNESETSVSVSETKKTTSETTTTMMPEHVSAETFSSAGTTVSESQGEESASETVTSVSVVGTDSNGETVTEIVTVEVFASEPSDKGVVPAAVKVIVCVLVAAVILTMLYIIFSDHGFNKKNKL